MSPMDCRGCGISGRRARGRRRACRRGVRVSVEFDPRELAELHLKRAPFFDDLRTERGIHLGFEVSELFDRH